MSATTLYRFYGYASVGSGKHPTDLVPDVLLYVGITGNPGRRFQDHAKTKGWFSDVTHATIEHFRNRQEAEAAERVAIIEERPKYNVTHSGKQRRASEVFHERGAIQWGDSWFWVDGMTRYGQKYQTLQFSRRLIFLQQYRERFDRQVNPTGNMNPQERARRADHARRAYELSLTYRSHRARAAWFVKHGEKAAA
jgi:hypothetical protein